MKMVAPGQHLLGFDLGPCCIWQQSWPGEGRCCHSDTRSPKQMRVLPSSSGALLELREAGTATPFHIGNQGPIQITH